jgi:hypothetical protein
MRNQPLTVLLHRLNWVLRSWTTYFRHGSSWATFDYLRAFTWRRVVCWLRRKHPRISWKELRRRYLPGWWPTQGAVRMFNPAAVMIVRYPYRGAKIPTVDQRHAGITRMRSLIWTGGAPVARQRARRVRRRGSENGPSRSMAPRSGPTPTMTIARCRAYLRRRGIRSRIARRMVDSSERLGRHRWRIERGLAGRVAATTNPLRALSSERFYALVMLACSVICFNSLQQPPW